MLGQFGSGLKGPQNARMGSAQMDGADDTPSGLSSMTSSGGSSPMLEMAATKKWATKKWATKPEMKSTESPSTHETIDEPKKNFSPRVSRSTSPVTGLERAASPISFGYPYHQARGGFFSNRATPTAIRS
jgi:hypothetical protein